MNSSQEINKQPTVIVLPNTTSIPNHPTNTSPRASNALNAIPFFDPTFAGVCKTKELFKLITVDFDFQDCLTFRLISQSMCEIMRSFLQSKARISFWFSQLFSTPTFMDDMRSFIEREEVKVDIICSVTYWLQYGYNYERKNLNFILKIDHINEIIYFNQFLLLNENITLDSIQGLDLKNIYIDSSNVQVISEFFSNIVNSAAAGLLGLALGHVGAHLKLPAFNHLESLHIQSISHSTQVQLPEFLDKLKDLTIGCINYNAFIHFPICLSNLTTCTIGYLYTPLKLPELPNLKQLSIGGLLIHNDLKQMDQIQYYGWLALPESLPNLQEFSISQIGDGVPFHLTARLDKLKKLVFGEIGWRVEIKLQTALDNLIELFMQNLHSDTILELPPSLGSLRMVSIRWLQERAKISFPPLLNNFETLIIHEIEESVNICFQDLDPLPKFKSLIITEIKNRAVFQLPDALVNVKELTVQSLGCNTVLTLPTLLSHLISLTINNFLFNAKCDLSSVLLPNLKNLILGKKEQSAIVLLPEELNNLSSSAHNINSKLETLIIGNNHYLPSILELPLLNLNHLSNENLRNNGAFVVPTLPNNRSSYAFGDIESDELCTKVCSLQNLTNLSIDVLGEELILLLPSTIGNLTSFNINYLLAKCTLALPDSLLTLKDLSIGIMSEGATLKLPDSLQTLETLKLADIDNKGVIEYQHSAESIHYDSFISQFLCSLPNLKNLSIQTISATTSLVLPHSVLHLQSLTINTISKKVNFTLTSSNSIRNLETLIIKRIEKKAYITISGEYDHLKTLELGNIESKSDFYFDCSFNNLNTLILGDVKTNLTLSDSLNKVQKITISAIYCENFEFPSTLDNLTTLEIDFLPNYDTQLVFPKFLPKLKNLTINGQKAIFQPPSLTHATKSFFIDSREANTVKFLQLVNSALIPTPNMQDRSMI